MKANYGAQRDRNLSKWRSLTMPFIDPYDFGLTIGDSTKFTSAYYADAYADGVVAFDCVERSYAYKHWLKVAQEHKHEDKTDDVYAKALCTVELWSAAIVILSRSRRDALEHFFEYAKQTNRSAIFEAVGNGKIQPFYEMPNAMDALLWTFMDSELYVIQMEHCIDALMNVFLGSLSDHLTLQAMYATATAVITFCKLQDYTPNLAVLSVCKRNFSHIGELANTTYSNYISPSAEFCKIWTDKPEPRGDDTSVQRIPEISLGAFYYAIKERDNIPDIFELKKPSTYKERARRFIPAVYKKDAKDIESGFWDRDIPADYATSVKNWQIALLSRISGLESHMAALTKVAEDTINGIHDKYNDLRNKYKETLEQNRELLDMCADYRDEVRKSEKMIGTLKTAVEKRDTEIASLKSRIEDLEKRTPVAKVKEPSVQYVYKERDEKAISKLMRDIEQQRQEIEALKRERDELLIYKEMQTAVEASPELPVVPTFTDEELSILRSARIHVTGPDTVAFRQIEKLLPAGKFTYITLSHKTEQFSVPLNMDAYIFCTPSMGHANFRQWKKQLHSLKTKQFLCGKNNPEAVCWYYLNTVLKSLREVKDDNIGT